MAGKLRRTSPVVDAAERVRVARTMAAWRQDDDSAKELADALAAFEVACMAAPQPEEPRP